MPRPKGNQIMSSRAPALSISDATWQRLVTANKIAVEARWAEPGVFATGVGPAFRRGQAGSLLYVGKSAGPRGTRVGLSNDQQAGCKASADWMIERRNLSAFWQFVDCIDRTRQSIAWTNICKMDRKGGKKPPTLTEWRQVSEPCIASLEEEMVSLTPRVTVFATSGFYQSEISTLLFRLNFQPYELQFDDEWTTCARSSAGQFAISTRHPQGWSNPQRDRVVNLIKDLLVQSVDVTH
jgi:hypothetical protein